MHQKLSIKLSYLLRHKPEDANLTMNSEGWVSISSINSNTDITSDILHEIVSTDEKNRYELSEDGLFIRARQGHSIPHINVGFEKKDPPDILYHGTTLDNFNKIIQSNKILPMSRQYVHLSESIETAASVGSRRKNTLVICEIDTSRMIDSGFEFLVSTNNVWQVTEVPLRFIKLIIPE